MDRTDGNDDWIEWRDPRKSAELVIDSMIAGLEGAAAPRPKGAR